MNNNFLYKTEKSEESEYETASEEYFRLKIDQVTKVKKEINKIKKIKKQKIKKLDENEKEKIVEIRKFFSEKLDPYLSINEFNLIDKEHQNRETEKCGNNLNNIENKNDAKEEKGVIKNKKNQVYINIDREKYNSKYIKEVGTNLFFLIDNEKKDDNNINISLIGMNEEYLQATTKEYKKTVDNIKNNIKLNIKHKNRSQTKEIKQIIPENNIIIEDNVIIGSNDFSSMKKKQYENDGVLFGFDFGINETNQYRHKKRKKNNSFKKSTQIKFRKIE